MLEFVDISKNKEYLTKGYLDIIRFYTDEKDTLNRLKYCKESVNNIPDDADLLNKYAWAICDCGIKDQLEKAEQMAELAVKIDSSKSNIWDTLGQIYYAMGKKEKALNAMKKALELKPDSDYLKENLKKIQLL
jgi:Flp pilus assembly protein TadD